MRTVSFPGPSLAARLAVSAAGSVLLFAAAASAEPARQLRIPAGDLDAALLSLAAQTHVQLLYTPDVVAGRHVAGMHGAFTTDQALHQLLGDGGGIVVTRPGPNS